jgi:hypothetical protein
LHHEELQNLYSCPSIIRINKVKEDEMGRACSTDGRVEKCMYDIDGKARWK